MSVRAPTRTSAAEKISALKPMFASSPIEMFPFLMIVLLLFLAFENLLSNKFYKSAPKPNAPAAVRIRAASSCDAPLMKAVLHDLAKASVKVIGPKLSASKFWNRRPSTLTSPAGAEAGSPP